MRISLLIDGKEKTFTVPFVKGRMFRRVIEINKNYNLNDVDVETLDTLVEFVIECFNNQFTMDDFYDGIAADKLIDTVLDIFEKVAGVAGKSDPNLKKS